MSNIFTVVAPGRRYLKFKLIKRGALNYLRARGVSPFTTLMATIFFYAFYRATTSPGFTQTLRIYT